MPKQPYIFFGLDYKHMSAGRRVCHKLVHLLREKGEISYLYEFSLTGTRQTTNPRWNTPIISRTEGNDLIEEGAIVIYPEIVPGNPLMARNVVRYILNTPGLLGGDKQYAASEILFSFNRQLLQPGMTEDRILCIPDIDTSIFYDAGEKRDIEYLVYFGKQKEIKGYPRKNIIYRDRPARQEELGSLLRRCKKLISYDNFTALIYEATLCGCPVVIIPDGLRKKEEIKAAEFGFNGVAWGDAPEELDAAIKTLPRARTVLEDLENKVSLAIENFIAVTQKIAGTRNAKVQNREKSVSFIIYNYNGKERLRKNLSAVLEHLPKEIKTEVLVVDRGMNEGAKAAKYDFLFFLCNEIEVTEGFLPPLLRHFDDPAVFGVSPKILRTDQAFDFFSLCAAAMLVDADKFKRSGGMDEMLRPFYYGGIDLSYRALKRGWKIIYEPKSLVLDQRDHAVEEGLSKSSVLSNYRKDQYLCAWKNVFDPWLTIRHLFQMVIPKLLTMNPAEWRAFNGALKQMAELSPRRDVQRMLGRVSDREVLKKGFKWLF